MSFTDAECKRCRKDFPALARTIDGQPIAFFDGPGGTQVPNSVIAAIRDSYIECNSNFDGMFATSRDVGISVGTARAAVADFLGAATSDSISFGANMTSLNYALSHALRRQLMPGDEIVITELDHEANRGPWLQLQADGIVIREVRLQPNGLLDSNDLEQKIGDKTKIVAIGLASNSLGTATDIKHIRRLCNDYGALLVVDAVHYAAHFPLDVQSLDPDFLLCSAYKFYGPHIGILYSRPGLLDQLDTDCLRTQKGYAPYNIETGTLNHAAIAGVTAAIDYIARWGSGATRREKLVSAMNDIHEYESALAMHYLQQVSAIHGVRTWGPDFTEARAPTVSVSFDVATPETIAQSLGDAGIQVWHGHFYAMKVLEVLGLDDRGGLMRVGMSMYNTIDEVDRLTNGIAVALDMARKS